MALTKKWVLYEVMIRVLVVDHDSTSLKIVSKMLSVCGYEVVTAKCAIDALRIVRERENDLHLILTEVHLPDMGRYELLEKIMEQTSKLPIVIMSADDNEIVKLGYLFKGAMLHLVKPLSMKSIKHLWQFSFMIKGRERSIPIRTPNRVQEESINKNDSDQNELIRNEKKKCQRTKRKEQDQEVSRELEEDGIDSTVLKRPKLIWTEQLHNRFLQAIKVLGVDKAHPKEILQSMNVPGLRKENISSHLQKFRLSLKRDQQDAIQKKMPKSSSNLKDESVGQIPNQQVAINSPSLSHIGRQLPNNIGVFMAKPPFGQETQPQPSNNILPSTSVNSNLVGSCDGVSLESLTNCNMDDSCFSKVISSQTCSMNSTQPRLLEDQEGHQSWFECKREKMTMSTMHLPLQVEEERHCMFKVDEGELDGILDIVKDFTITLHELGRLL